MEGCLCSFLHFFQLATGGRVRNRWKEEDEEPGTAGLLQGSHRKAVPRSEHLGPILGAQALVTGMGLTPCCCLLPTKGGPNPFHGVQGPSQHGCCPASSPTSYPAQASHHVLSSLHISLPLSLEGPSFLFYIEDSDTVTKTCLSLAFFAWASQSPPCASAGFTPLL